MLKKHREFRYHKTCFVKLLEAGIKDPEAYLRKKYLSGMSFTHIAEYLLESKNILVTPRGVSYYVPKEMRRNKSQAKKKAMEVGRMVYRKKPEHELYKAKGVSAGIRLQVLQRDEYRCQLCGNGRKEGSSLEIHHKEGPDSDPENLQTLCYLCHRGLHIQKREEEKLQKAEKTDTI